MNPEMILYIVPSEDKLWVILRDRCSFIQLILIRSTDQDRYPKIYLDIYWKSHVGEKTLYTIVFNPQIINNLYLSCTVRYLKLVPQIAFIFSITFPSSLTSIATMSRQSYGEVYIILCKFVHEFEYMYNFTDLFVFMSICNWNICFLLNIDIDHRYLWILISIY